MSLYIINFTVSCRLIYQRQIGRLLWWKCGLDCTKYSISPNFFRGESLTFQWRRATTGGSVTTTTLQPALHHPPSSNGIAVFLQTTTGELPPTFCKGSLLKKLVTLDLYDTCWKHAQTYINIKNINLISVSRVNSKEIHILTASKGLFHLLNYLSSQKINSF